MSKEKNINDFLEGNQSVKDAFQNMEEQLEDKKFLEAYQAAIEGSKEEQIPGFDPFAKIPAKSRQGIKYIVKRVLPYAAAVIFLFSISMLIRDNNQSSQALKLTEQELIELNQNAIYALSLLSSELNNSLKELENTSDLGEPFKRMSQVKIN